MIEILHIICRVSIRIKDLSFDSSQIQDMSNSRHVFYHYTPLKKLVELEPKRPLKFKTCLLSLDSTFRFILVNNSYYRK
jgi:hypothetical protein